MTTKTPRTWIGARVSPAAAAMLAEERSRTGESLGRVLDRAVLALASAHPTHGAVAPTSPQEIHHD